MQLPHNHKLDRDNPDSRTTSFFKKVSTVENQGARGNQDHAYRRHVVWIHTISQLTRVSAALPEPAIIPMARNDLPGAC